VTGFVAAVQQKLAQAIRAYENVSSSVGLCCRVKAESANLAVQLRPPAAGSFDPQPLLTYNQGAGTSEFGNGWLEAYRRKVVQSGNNATIDTGTGEAYACAPSRNDCRSCCLIL
jgi:hypothetical protein